MSLEAHSPVRPVRGGLVLRPWLPADARAVAAAYADPVIQLCHARRVDGEDEARELILRWQRSWSAETGAHWAVARSEGNVTERRARLAVHRPGGIPRGASRSPEGSQALSAAKVAAKRASCSGRKTKTDREAR